MDQAVNLAELGGLESPVKLCLLLAALFHDVGKPGAARWEFKRGRMAITSCGHDVLSERISRRVFARFKIFSWNGCNLRRMVPLLIRTHHRASELWQNRKSVTRKAFKRLAADVDGEIDLVVYLDAADRAGGRRGPSKASTGRPAGSSASSRNFASTGRPSSRSSWAAT